MKHCPKFKADYDIVIAQSIIDWLCDKYNIVREVSFKGAVGRANIKEKYIKIPEPKTSEHFMVILHEIGHIIKGWGSRAYITEFKADQFALNYAKKSNLNIEYIEEYEKRAKGYLMMVIAKGYCRHLNLDTIKPKVLEWLKYDFNKWKNNKVYITGWVGSCTIQFTNNNGDVINDIIIF